MNERRQDFELLQRFTREGEQSAFADVVQRHLDLVYGTAMRKVEDPGAAQEVAQNVFAALGRKAWQFAPDDSLPAWLHKAALLEAKSWLRHELGRRRREQIAAEMGTTMNTPDPAFAALVPLLDEALLSLGERDRTALLLRFYENQSLRDVGAALGAGEDAATKRVRRALDKLTAFFQRRGFKTASVAVVTTALQHAATTTSAAVATSVMGTALQTAPPALSGFKRLLARLAILPRPQRAALGGALAMALLLLSLFSVRSLQAANRPSLAIERAGTNIVVRFTGALARAGQPQGPFRPVPGARSPFVLPAGAGQEFWRAWMPGVHTISAGYYHSVALRTDGTLWTWGNNGYGQLGNGTVSTNNLGAKNTPQQIGSDANWRAVAAGGTHTAALRTDGSLWAWGKNSFGQLGNGVFNLSNNGDPPPGAVTPQRIGSDTNWQAITVGTDHTVALRTDGTLWAWGINRHGELGIGTFSPFDPGGTNTPQQVGSDTNWLAAAAGISHTVALRTDGTLWAWGRNYDGELGIGSFTTNAPYGTNTPQRVGSDANWQAVAGGIDHTVALRTDGTLWAWGRNYYGQLGNGTFTTSAPYGISTPRQVGTNTDWQAIEAGDRYTLALCADGTLWAWGLNVWGQLGIGAFSTNAPNGINTPQRVGTNASWQAIAASSLHVLAARADGTLWAWGKNSQGQLGIGTFTTNVPYGMNTPQQVGTNSNWGPPP